MQVDPVLAEELRAVVSSLTWMGPIELSRFLSCVSVVEEESPSMDTVLDPPSGDVWVGLVGITRPRPIGLGLAVPLPLALPRPRPGTTTCN